MNKLPGIIDEIITEGHLSIVRITVDKAIFKSIVVDTPVTAPYLKVGNEVSLLFKENEVIVARAFTGQISLQNRFECVIKELEMGKLLCRVVMDYKEFEIVSLITAQASMQLNLAIGDAVTAMVKTNEISLSPHD